MEEIWKDITGYEGQYQISNFGNLKSVDRYTDSIKERHIKEKLLVGAIDRGGYRRFCLRSPKTNRVAHRMVAEAFIPNTENKPQVNHKNGIKTDNRVENLEWNTSKENVNHALDNGLRKHGEHIRSAKLTKEDVKSIRKLRRDGVFLKNISKTFNIHVSNISRICSGENWKRTLFCMFLSTICLAQTDSSNICLTNKQFDFYAQSVVEKEGLKSDTASCGEIVRVYDGIITTMDEQLTNHQDIITNQQIMIDMKNKDFIKLALDYDKQKKKTKRFQQSTLVFVATTIVLALLVLIK